MNKIPILNSYYTQTTAERDISADNFTRGQINFKWDMEGNMAMRPDKSYFKVRINLSKVDGTPLDEDDRIAPNMYLVDHLFQQMKMMINGHIISSVDDYVAQIAALKRRISQGESRSRILGRSLELSQASYYDRVHTCTPSGINTLRQYPQLQGKPVNVVAENGQALDILRLSQIQFVAAAGGVPDLVNITGAANGPLVTQIKGRDLFSVGEWLFFTDGAGQKMGQIRQINENTPAANQIQLYVNVFDAGGNAANFGAAALANYDGTQIRKRTMHHWGHQHDRQVSSFELIWQPKMGFWEINDYIQGKFKFELTPVILSNLHQRVVESLAPKTSADFKFEVVSMTLWNYTGYATKPYTGTIDYLISDTNMQAHNLTTASLSNKIFHVDPNTFALTFAVQTGLAGTDTRYSAAKFKLPNNEELGLTRYYITFKGIQLPRVIPDPSKTNINDISTTSTNVLDYTTQNFYEALQYSGALSQKSDCEDIQTWVEKGPFYHYEWPEIDNPSNECIISTQFTFKDTSPILNYNPQIILFNHYMYKFVVHINDGVVTNISS